MLARRVLIGSAVAAGGFVIAAMAQVGALQGGEPSVARIKPFSAPETQAAASCVAPINTLEKQDEQR